jgi:hypothetical protein
MGSSEGAVLSLRYAKGRNGKRKSHEVHIEEIKAKEDNEYGNKTGGRGLQV